MNKLISAAVASALLTGMAMAQEAIVAKKVDDVTKVTPTSKVWDSVKGTEVDLYPQTTITLNDAKANAANAHDKAKAATAKAIYDGKNIAFLLIWPDGTRTVQSGYRSDSYADGFAVQLPETYSDVKKLPYIGMGSAGRSVVIHLQKAVQPIFEPNGNGDVGMQQNVLSKPIFTKKQIQKYHAAQRKLATADYQRAFVSEGFRSMTEIKDGSETFDAKMRYDHRKWRGTLVRPLKDAYVNLNSGAFPVSFAVWDGARMQRDGLKRLSQWVPVKLEGKKGGEALVKALTAAPKGDAANGKKLVMQNGCAGCHYIPGMSQPGFTAPGFANIGGYSTKAYLRESIVDPSAVVVPGYNRNAHPNTPWYHIVDGKRVSVMPPYPLDDKSLDDMVAYLKTLKAEVQK